MDRSNIQSIMDQLLDACTPRISPAVAPDWAASPRNKKTVAEIADHLLAILGPPQATKHARARLLRRWSLIEENLTEAIVQARRSRRDPSQPDDSRRWAENVVQGFLVSLPELKTMAKQDTEAMFEADPALTDPRDVWITPGIQAITIYRAAHHLEKLGVPCIPRMMTESAHSKWQIDIHPGATIGPRFCIDHGTGVVIGETVQIGSNVRLYQGVTLGALTFPKDEHGDLLRGPLVKRHPTLEDNVIVYASASILGGDTVVGRGTVIGSNVRLTESVGPDMFVRVDKPNFRVDRFRPFGPWPVQPPVTISEDYLMRKALSEYPDDGNPNCGDGDEIDWPPKRQ